MTRTTEQMREWCADDGGVAEYHDPINGHREADRARKEFDEWLAAHDAEVAATAWDEGFAALYDFRVTAKNYPPANPYRAAAQESP